ncbi:MAG: hypothetical protein KatS3mg016_0982 [Fimbriimonadales bacterium]|nr:MAG: hypothetical protein KatS3mg016_0982 [Fimbriimonadales bacterium]
MKKWMMFGLSLLALTASLALSACGSQEQTSGEQPAATSGAPEGQPAQPAEGSGTGTTEGGQSGTGTTEGGHSGTSTTEGGQTGGGQ